MPDGSLDDIERRVAEDRARLSQSLDELAHNLEPERLKAQAEDAARRYGGDVGRQVWGAAQENPAAFALVGAGLALLLSGAGRRPDNDGRSTEAARGSHEMEEVDRQVATSDRTLLHQVAGSRPEPMRSSRLRAAIGRGLDQLPPVARARVREARLAALRAQEEVERRAAKAGRRTGRAVERQPVTAGAVAFGLGALVATLLPATRHEDEAMGARRDALMEQARETMRREIAALEDAASDANANRASDRRDARLDAPFGSAG